MSTCQDKDTVLMYQWPRGITVPCPSPFVLKLETYFRMANIKYKSDHSGKLSKKGKIPWIVVDGQAVADSSFVIQHLNKRFEVDLNQSLSSKDKAIAHSYIKMMEENTFW